jgi:hypothetical protein
MREKKPFKWWFESKSGLNGCSSTTSCFLYSLWLVLGVLVLGLVLVLVLLMLVLVLVQ